MNAIWPTLLKFCKRAFAAPACVFTTEACAAPGGVYTTGDWAATEWATLQRPVLLLEVSKPPRHELHINVSTLLRPVMLLEVSTPQGLELHLDLSILHRLDMSTPKDLSFTWSWLENREPVLLLGMCTHWGLSCTWMCLIHSDQCLSIICLLCFLNLPSLLCFCFF
jgi:hypothetical protein